MYCIECGALNKDDAIFCINCGKPMQGAEPVQTTEKTVTEGGTPQPAAENAHESGQEDNPSRIGYPEDTGRADSAQGNDARAAGEGAGGMYTNPYPAGSQPPKKKPDKKLLIIIAAAAAAVVIAVIIIIAASAGSGKTAIDLADYVTVEITGYDGEGTASVSVNSGWYLEAYNIIEDKYSNKPAKYLEAAAALVYVDVDAQADKTEGLSNGDVITITITVDDGGADGLPVKFRTSTFTYEVEGLAELTTVDLFEDVEVVFEGCAPYATVSVEGDCDYIYVYYYCDIYSNLSNGDTVTIYAEYDADDLLDAGYKAESNTMEVTVSGLGSYVMELSDFSDEAIETMKSNADKIIQAEIDNYTMTDTYELEYTGLYFISLKEDVSYSSNINGVYLVYHATGTLSYSMGDFDYYIVFGYSDVAENADGSYTLNLADGDYAGGYLSWEPTLGYETLEAAYDELVSANSGYYNYETTITGSSDADAEEG